MRTDSNRVRSPISSTKHTLLRLVDRGVGSRQGLLLTRANVELRVDECLHQLLVSLLVITCLVQIAIAFAAVGASLSRINSDTALFDVGGEIAICSIYDILLLLYCTTGCRHSKR